MPFEPFTEVNEFTAEDWQEALATWQPGGGDTVSNETAEATIQLYLPANKIRSATSFILGYSFADDDTPYELHRVTPVAHPFYGWQYRAKSISFQRFGPQGNEDNDDNAPWDESEIIPELDAAGNPFRHGRYQKALATVRFGTVPYLMWEDDDPDFSGDEWDRYVRRIAEPQLEALSAETDRFLRFVDGPTGVTGKDFQGSVNELMAKTNLTWVWEDVPHEFIFDANNIPAKILSCVGRVNDATFAGHERGTLMLQPPRFEQHLFPFYSEDGRAFHYRVTLPFVHFDPTPGPDSTSGARGWRLFPSRFGGVNGGPGWFLATRKDAAGNATASSPGFLEETDFTQIFAHVLS